METREIYQEKYQAQIHEWTAELDVLKAYLPEEASDSEIEKAVEKAIRVRVPESNAGEMAGLLEQAQAGVVELLQGVQQVEDSRDTIQAQRRELQGELAEMRRDREQAEPVTAADAIAERDRQIERLERRIAKLVTSLEETEQVLKRVAAMKNYEFGVSSIYRMVQGLSEGDPEANVKREMMSRIFQANVALQSGAGKESH